jgi:hypothetical protein
MRRRMGEAGHAVARWQFDWHVQSASFLAELVRIAQRRPAGPPSGH